MLRSIGFLALVIVLAGCSPSGSQPNLVQYAPVAAQFAPASHGKYNIFWNKKSLNLSYGDKMPAKAVLTYWAPSGYYTDESCNNGGKFSATPGRTWGNPRAYKHVLYSFEAQSAGRARCGFAAILNNTGSPPIASLTLNIK